MDPTALYKISYGLYVITSKKGDKINGQTANALIQVTGEPPALAIGINTQNLTNEYIKESGVFAVSIISQDTPLDFIGQFGFKSGRDINKFEKVNYKTGSTGAPLITDNTVAVLEAEVKHQMEVGTHTLFVGEVLDSEVIKEGEPMTYAYYHQVKRGTTPKTAPTFRIAIQEGSCISKLPVHHLWDIPTILRKVILMQAYHPEHLLKIFPIAGTAGNAPYVVRGKISSKSVIEW